MSLFALNSAFECLYSTVRNVSGREAYFGFLPEHGKRLADGEEVTVWGDVQHHTTKLTPNNRARRALEAALGEDVNDQMLAIVNGPAVHLADITTGDTKILALDNSEFTDVDPCWGSYSEDA